MSAFCRQCGHAIHEEAPACPQCGAVQEMAKGLPEAAPDEAVWLPVTSLVIGIIGALSLFDENEWSRKTALLVGLIGVLAFTAGVFAINRQKAGRGMAIAGVVLGSLTMLCVLGLLSPN